MSGIGCQAPSQRESRVTTDTVRRSNPFSLASASVIVKLLLKGLFVTVKGSSPLAPYAMKVLRAVSQVKAVSSNAVDVPD
jgi:hypothetical protein